MKPPHDLAEELKSQRIDGFLHETFRLPRSEARKATVYAISERYLYDGNRDMERARRHDRV
jgi:hypothetical protein